MAENPWLDFYDSGVPHSLKPYPDKTLCNLLSENAKAQPGKAAVYFEGAQMTWSELEMLSNLFARVLVDMGIQKGDRVALILPNCPQFLICQFGAWKVGAIVSPLNPLYLASELKHALNETGAALAVTLTLSYEALKSIQGDTRIEIVIATSIKDYLPPLKRILFTLFLEKSSGHRIKLQRGDHWLTELLDQIGSSIENAIPGDEVLVDASDPALLMFTGGTEGPPKAAIMSHQALIASGLQIHAWSGDLKEDWKDVNLMIMPMYHAYGNLAVLPAAIIGKHLMVLVPDPRDLDGLLKTINK
ncbi:MAG: AMP-binding protein, partial [Candidatus Promineifilaceae bacterium]